MELTLSQRVNLGMQCTPVLIASFGSGNPLDKIEFFNGTERFKMPERTRPIQMVFHGIEPLHFNLERRQHKFPEHLGGKHARDITLGDIDAST